MSIDEAAMHDLSNGIMIGNQGNLGHQETAAVDAKGRLVAVLAQHGNNQLRPTVNFAPALLAQSHRRE
jgi:hypothetical protein